MNLYTELFDAYVNWRRPEKLKGKDITFKQFLELLASADNDVLQTKAKTLLKSLGPGVLD